MQSVPGPEPENLQGNDALLILLSVNATYRASLSFRGEKTALVLRVFPSFWMKNVKCFFKEKRLSFLPAEEEITWIKVRSGTGT